MKTFIIINGKSAKILQRESLQEANQTAINTCNHSDEVIVREISHLTDHTATFINLPVILHTNN